MFRLVFSSANPLYDFSRSVSIHLTFDHVPHTVRDQPPGLHRGTVLNTDNIIIYQMFIQPTDRCTASVVCIYVQLTTLAFDCTMQLHTTNSTVPVCVFIWPSDTHKTTLVVRLRLWRICVFPLIFPVFFFFTYDRFVVFFFFSLFFFPGVSPLLYEFRTNWHTRKHINNTRRPGRAYSILYVRLPKVCNNMFCVFK